MNDRNTLEILDELKSLAPTLATLPKKMPYDVPTHYFDMVENEILEQVSLLKYELNQPVPYGYFEDMEDKLMPLMHESKDIKPKIQHVTSLRRWIYGAAAIFTLAITSILVFSNQAKGDNIPLDEDAYLLYIQENIDDFEIDQMVENELVEESDVTLITFEHQNPEYDLPYILPSNSDD
jgi:hypothetical protein